MSCPFTAETCQAVNSYASKHGHKITFVSADSRPDSAAARNARPLDGLIVLNADSIAAEAKPWLDAGLPAVMVNRPSDGFSGNFVGSTDERGAHQATRHLLELGHRRIAHLNHGTTVRTYAMRLAGYCRAVRELGFGPDRSLIVECHATIADGRRAARQLLSLANPPTAIFAGTDLAALGAANAVLERGLRVPRDVSVVGFMDLAMLANSSLPMTTVRMHIEDMGRTAARALDDIVQGNRDEPVQITMDTALIVRDTTSKPPRA